MDLVNYVLKQHGVEHFGMTPLKAPISLNFYKTWLDRNYHGEMQYLQDHLEVKAQPEKLLPQARSAIVIAEPYVKSAADFPLKATKIAAYARNSDYHYWLKHKLQKICADLKSLYPDHEFEGFTDSSPVLERDLAHRAGLGWFGKNTCLIDKKKGSLFFIAEIFTSLPADEILSLPTDHCGTCNRCIEACPTDAIESDKTLNATKCISYWTIEAREIPPVDLRKHFSGWFFGCDICQTVCPWNIKAFGIQENETDLPSTAAELRDILQSSNNGLLRKFAGTPLTRTGGRGLKRNAMIVAANLRITELAEDVQKYTDDKDLGELARWSLQQLSPHQ